MKKAFTIEKKIIAQVRYYETLYLVRDAIDLVQICLTTKELEE